MSSRMLPIHSRPGRVVAGIASLLLLGACRGDAGGDIGGAPVSRDSAGVLVVDASWNGREEWRLDSLPELTLGSYDDEAQAFSSVLRARRLSDGTIVVADGGSAELRFFDGRGQLLATAGGRGEGPGEFRRLTGALAVLPGDTLLAYDGGNRRIVAFDGRGQWLTTTTVQADEWRSSKIQVAGWLGSHGLVAYEEPPPPSADPHALHAAPARMLLLDRTGAAVREVGEIAVPVFATGPQGQSRPVHVLPRPLFALGDGELWYSLPFRYEVLKFSPAGLTGVLRFRREPHALGANDRRALRRRFEEMNRPDALPPALAENVAWMVANVVIRDSLPALRRLHVDRLGNLWLQEHAGATPLDEWSSLEPPGSREYMVVASSGRGLATVRLPDSFEVHEIGPDYVLGVHRDSMNVESVRLYRLVR